MRLLLLFAFPGSGLFHLLFIVAVAWRELGFAPRADMDVLDDDLRGLRVLVPRKLPAVVASEINGVPVQVLVDAGSREQRDVNAPFLGGETLVSD